MGFHGKYLCKLDTYWEWNSCCSFCLWNLKIQVTWFLSSYAERASIAEENQLHRNYFFSNTSKGKSKLLYRLQYTCRLPPETFCGELLVHWFGLTYFVSENVTWHNLNRFFKKRHNNCNVMMWWKVQQ